MKVYPVVHTQSPEQAVEQAGIAFDAGSDGVFLINQSMRSERSSIAHLLEDYNAVADTFGGRYIGLNFLVDPYTGYRLVEHALRSGSITRPPDALWFDDATGREKTPRTVTEYLGKVAELREAHSHLGAIEFLGGVAFKYTPGYTDKPRAAARQVKQLNDQVDVITTSGPGTGRPPTPAKIQAMKAAVGHGELAVASGIGAENVDDYKGPLDRILVASSLETEPYSGEFVPERVRALIEKAKS